MQEDPTTTSERFLRVWDRIEALQRAIDKSEALNDARVGDALRSMDARMAAANEFRSSINDIVRDGASRKDLETLKEFLVARIVALEIFKTTLEDRREETKKAMDGRFRTFAVLMTLIGIALNLMFFFLSKK